ncbi:MAG: hypothetical protein U1F49_21415 [Rubrivivax sp.]
MHTLHGLEPDNLLAFLALLGALRALGAADPALNGRVSWSIDAPPLRPRLHVPEAMSREALLERLTRGAEHLARAHVFGNRADLDFTAAECRVALWDSARVASLRNRTHSDLLASLMHDAAVKEGKEDRIDATPLCLLFGQGHQHFLQRLAEVPSLPAPPPRGRGNAASAIGAAECLSAALFAPWRRDDPTKSFRWDPAEDVRYATMACDPTDAAFKGGTQHGANRLAALGLGALTMVCETRLGRARPAVVGGARDREGFSIAWPIWRDAITLHGILALLAHPALREPGALQRLGVVQVMAARRISVGKFMNFTRARVIA